MTFPAHDFSESGEDELMMICFDCAWDIVAHYGPNFADEQVFDELRAQLVRAREQFHRYIAARDKGENLRDFPPIPFLE